MARRNADYPWRFSRRNGWDPCFILGRHHGNTFASPFASLLHRPGIDFSKTRDAAIGKACAGRGAGKMVQLSLGSRR